METVNRYLFAALEQHADRPMQIRRDRVWTYREAAEAVHGIVRELHDRGVRPGDRVALIAENSPRWFHVYLAILAAGGVAVPRGVDIGADEMRRIVEHSGSRLIFAENAEAAARAGDGPPVIRLDDDAFPEPVPAGPDVLRAWAAARAPDDLAVLLYTSGTTGRPKGVMLEHKSLAHNIRVLPPIVDMQAGDAWVSILPSWHTFEQTIELCGHAIGCVTIYSDRRRLRDDLAKHRPQFFASVPRIWETIHDAARKKIEERGGLVRALFRATYAGSRS
jgi:long-chain acyl-CoA synthetase